MERLVDRAYATFGEEARRRGIDYERELDGEPVIVSDGDRVLQIISNLLSNAFRWTPDGGRIDLALRRRTARCSWPSRTRGPGIRPRSGSGSSGRSGRTTAAAPASAWRSRASSRSRSAAGSSSTASRGGQPLRAAAVRPLCPSAASRVRAARSASSVAASVDASPGSAMLPPAPRSARRAAAVRRPPAAAVDEEPAALRRDLFAAQLGDAARWLEALARLRRLLRGLERGVPLQRPPRRRARPAHPVKRLRPIARGELPVAHGARARRGLVAARRSRGAAVARARGSVAVPAGFLVLQAGVHAGLKHVVLIDVMAIAGLFVIRAAAGAEAVDVRISPWLLLCTALLALFLALAKRRGELVLVGAEATPGRPVLEGYSLALVDQLVAVVAASTVIAYSLYTFTARDSKAMMATIPFVALRRLPLPAADPPRATSARSRRTCCSRDLPILLTVAPGR